MKSKIHEYLKKVNKTMSKKSILIVAVIISGFQTLYACEQQSNTEIVQNQITEKTDTIKVYGNCGMCKKRIEGALTKVKGIQSANWDVDTKMLTVTYDESKINLDDIHQKVADVGHDSDKAKAKDSVYNGLMGCCQYERPKQK